MKSVSTDSSCSCSSTRRPVGPPTSPVAITGLPSRLSARATLIPLPPATVRLSTARWRWPRRKLGTATVRSIAALRVTVRITGLSLPGLVSSSPPATDATPQEGSAKKYHERRRRGEDRVVGDEASDAVEDAGRRNRTAGPQGSAPRWPAGDEDGDAPELGAAVDRPLDLVRSLDVERDPLAGEGACRDRVRCPQRQLTACVADRDGGQLAAGVDRHPSLVPLEPGFEQIEAAVETRFVGGGADLDRDQLDPLFPPRSDQDVAGAEGVA